MSKLFALEELDTAVDAGELEATPEVGEVADVQVEVEQELGETAEATDAIEEGIGAADQLEQVETVVADAVENGEGLDPVAAEAIRIAVEAICARVGANPKAVYSLYATENFQSASSRKANSKIALEGVGEFLKDLWKKIKAALTRLWEKAKAFWDKHLSSLGRIKKALESMKTKVSESSGKLKDKAYLEEAPGGLADAVGFSGDISVKSIQAVIEAHKKFSTTSDDVINATSGFNSTASSDLSNPAKAIAGLKKSPTVKSDPLVGGVVITYKFEADEQEGTASLEIERENVDRKDKGGVSLSEKADVKGLLDDALKLIADNIKAKDKLTKMQDAFNKLALAIEKSINDQKQSKVDDLRKSMKIAYAINAKAPVVFHESLAQNVKLAKAVLGYAALCVKSYK